jgi:hypothetical protein
VGASSFDAKRAPLLLGSQRRRGRGQGSRQIAGTNGGKLLLGCLGAWLAGLTMGCLKMDMMVRWQNITSAVAGGAMMHQPVFQCVLKVYPKKCGRPAVVFNLSILSLHGIASPPDRLRMTTRPEPGRSDDSRPRAATTDIPN